jgi:hypothetical protein
VTQHLDAFDSPPEVRAFDGEILITGDLVSAAYTVKAARALILSLQAAVAVAENGAVAGPGSAGQIRAVS